MRKVRNYDSGSSLWTENRGGNAKWVIRKDGSDYEFESEAAADRFIEDAFGTTLPIEPSVVECGAVELKPVDRLGE